MSSFSSIHLNMIHNESNYDLYLPSNSRQSCFVDIPIETEKLSVKINPFKMMYNNDREGYDALIDKFLTISPHMLFIGFSNSSAVFIEQGKQYIKFCNDNLRMHEGCPNNSSIKRIIITNDETVKMPYIVPMSKNKKFKFEPNYIGPKNTDTYENHISVYHVDNPTKYFYPEKDLTE